MSRSLQDQFIDDDEEETCPLCVEEFDLTDKGFRPCPCGYQICQFCYHNVKTNMNGLCPACRRPYRDEDIEYKKITSEETAAHKARQAQKQKKTQQILQKEKQKAEADNLSRKHLAGMRVVQKNLVYVTGLSPTSQEDQLLQTLRGDQYFGQYGKIIKIVVSKAKDPSHPHSVGVYVTYERKEDAASCIAAVDGSKNGDRTLRAQFGTTKYCSAYLRGENCTNRNCMFLHEPGEANESYSRADLSVLNAGSSQNGSGRPPPPQSQQPVAAQPMARQESSEQGESSERPALPSTASWASKVPQVSRAESRSTSTTLESPVPVHSTPAPAPPAPAPVQPEPQPEPQAQPDVEAPVEQISPTQSAVRIAALQAKKPQVSPLISLLKNLKVEDFQLIFSPDCLAQMERELVKNYPPLFDEVSGPQRRLRRQQQRDDEQRRSEQESQAFQQPSAVESDDNPEMSGSLQLGGEPEERQSVSQVQSVIHPPGQDGGLDQRFQYPAAVSSPGISDRGLTPQQHQQILLQTLKPNASGAYNQPSAFNSAFQQQANQPLGHQRNVSRYSFANDSSSASSAVKPVANAKLMNQQSSMMPPASGNHFSAQHQQPHGQFYTSNVQGPPPGLKTTGTPPVSGNLTFGQGHGFATGGLQYGAGSNRNQQDNYYRDLLRGRDGAAGGVDPKRELLSHPNNYTTHNAAYPAGQSSAFPNPPYSQLSAFGDGEKQRKKKGKKHRHANTSSSSGGGLADVSDAGAHNLLQARMHQGAGFGGNAFAGQAAGVAEDAEFPPLSGPSRQPSIVTRLSPAESRRTTPPIPPGFEAQVANESRRSTPSLPPGLPIKNVLPDLEGSSSRPTSRPASRSSLRRQTSQIFPAVPLRPGTPARIATPKLEKDDKENVLNGTPTKPSRSSTSTDLNVAISANTDESVQANTNDEQDTTQTTNQDAASDPRNKRGLAKPDTTSRETQLSTSPEDQSSNLTIAQPKDRDEKNEENSAIRAKSSRSDGVKQDAQKRKAPAKLDITAAVSKPVQHAAVPNSAAEGGAFSKPQRSFSSVSQTPASAKPLDSPGIGSPAVRSTAPRTLRVVPTPKTETPSPVAHPALPALVSNRLPSRQPSVASINPPATPSSEHVSMSDNLSMTSTSVSRANSPPPSSKVGSAPVRQKTKNQQKKDRQERAKALEVEKAKQDEVVKPSGDEPVIEAIVSRKKKEKKAKEVKPAKAKPATATVTANTTPTASRPVSPVGNGKTTFEVLPKAESPAPSLKEVKPATPVKSTPPPTVQCANPSPPPTPTLDPAQLIRDMKASAPHLQKCIDSLFRMSNSHAIKAQHNVSQKDLLAHFKADFKYAPTKEEIDALIKGTIPAIHYGGEDGRILDRGMISPSGAHLRALTEELEKRFLELEKALQDMPEELRFKPTKPQNETKFERMDLEALRRSYENGVQRGASVMEQMVQDGSTKKGAFLVDEASKYINEFVMPPVTPPPQRQQQQQQHGEGKKEQQHTSHLNCPGQAGMHFNLAVAERQLNEARRADDERQNSLKKMIKKNKKLLGLG